MFKHYLKLVDWILARSNLSLFTSHHSLKKNVTAKMMQVELILTHTPCSCCTLSLEIWSVVWLTFMLPYGLNTHMQTHVYSHTHTVREPVPLLQCCRRIISEHCVGKLHSPKFCIFSVIGFLRSSPHSSHCRAEIVDPTHTVCF